MEHQTDDHNDSWLDGAPTWVRVVQAVLIGLVAGLALHALLSLVVLQGSEGATCRRSAGRVSPQSAAAQAGRGGAAGGLIARTATAAT